MINANKSAKSKVYKHLISRMLDRMTGGKEPKETVDSDDSNVEEIEEGEKEDMAENDTDVGGQDENKSNVRDMLKQFMSTKKSHHGTMNFAKSKKSDKKPEVQIKGFKKV